jgi:acyl carrier protein
MGRRIRPDAGPNPLYPVQDHVMSDTLARLNEVFQDVFDDDEIAVNRGTTAADVEAWDSMMHVTLLVGIEKAFGMKFTSSEVARLKSVGDLADLIEAKRGA